MSTQPIDREDIFHAAAEISDAQQRSAFLQEKCQGDEKLIAEIEELLRHDGVLGSFLSDPILQLDVEATQQYESVVEKPGDIIGPYKLREPLGEGGFGLVFVAEQKEPVRRKVALKIIKPGMDTKEVLARFNAEQQALALMDHPHIARVFDAGMTESGRPYFVMEFIKGGPIVEYCNQQQLSIEERLQLFVTVCQAVQHAHTKGIIHRDLKPSNIMISPHDGVPVVKVIDFGVAKAIGQQLTNQTIYTSYSQMIGTPLYMSPEQAEINALDVDIRSDVYSLGVLLYELLTGTTPFDRDRFSTIGYDEIRRIIKEEDPPRPSTRLTTLGELLTTVSTERHTVPSKLSALMKGDLDWIVMQALEKDRRRRYQTANELAEDVQRYLQHELVEARPPSVMYRLRKSVRRNRTAAIVVSTILLALTMTTVGTSVGFIEANAGRKQAETAVKEKQQAVDDLREQQTALLLKQAELLIQRRKNGYKQQVLEIVKELNGRELSSDEHQALRRLALSTLGDPMALHPMAELKEFESGIHHVDLSPDGKWIAICHHNGRADLYEIATRRTVPIHPAAETSDGRVRTATRIRFLTAKSLMITSSEFSQSQIWELQQDVWKMTSERTWRYRPWGVVYAKDSGRFAQSLGLAIVVFESTDLLGEPLAVRPVRDSSGERNGVQSFDISPDGNLVAAKISDRQRKKWETMLWNIERDTVQHLPGVEWGAVRFSPDGRWLMISATNGIEVYETDRLEQLPDLSPTFYQRSDVVGRPEMAHDGRTLYIPSRQSNRIRVYDLLSNSEQGSYSHPGKPDFVCVSDDGGVLVTGSRRNLRIWNSGRLPERRVLIGHPDGTTDLAYSLDGTKLATTGKGDLVRIWDSESGELIRELDGGGQCVGLSAHDRWLAAGSRDSSQVRIWDTLNWTQLAEFDAQVGRKTWSVRFCDDDRRIVVSGDSGVRLINLQPEPFGVADFIADDATSLSLKKVTKVAVAGTRLFWKESSMGDDSSEAFYVMYDFNSASDPVRLEVPAVSDYGAYDLRPEGRLIVYNFETDRFDQLDDQLRPIGRPFGPPYSNRLKLHPKQDWAATCLVADSRFQVWNRETGALLLDFPNRGGMVWALAWNPQRDQLAVARSDGIVELWNLDEVEAELAKLGL